MKLVPVFKCSDMRQAIQFYTGVLDFQLKYPEAGGDETVVDLVMDEVELQLTTHESSSLYGSVINLFVDDVDARFTRYRSRGLDPSGKKHSPVHQGPVDQSWGNREFYVTDTDGNTLRFCQPLDRAVYLAASPYVEGRLLDLPVADVEKAVTFYTVNLNFRRAPKSTRLIPTITLHRDSVTMAIAENGGDPSQEGCFFEVDNVEKALRELQFKGVIDKSAEIRIEKHGEVNWRIFYLLAPDGLCFCFGERIVL